MYRCTDVHDSHSTHPCYCTFPPLSYAFQTILIEE
jgi:hypothetical protein